MAVHLEQAIPCVLWWLFLKLTSSTSILPLHICTYVMCVTYSTHSDITEVHCYGTDIVTWFLNMWHTIDNNVSSTMYGPTGKVLVRIITDEDGVKVRIFQLALLCFVCVALGNHLLIVTWHYIQHPPITAALMHKTSGRMYMHSYHLLNAWYICTVHTFTCVCVLTHAALTCH